MKRTLLLILFYSSFILFYSCNPKVQKGSVILPKKLPERQADTLDIHIEVADLEEIAVEVEELIYYGKTACYGKCPVFYLKVFSDGSLEYNGIKNVNELGLIQYKMPLEKIARMLQSIETKGFYKLKAHYPEEDARIKDFPSTILKINNKVKKHTVVNNYDAPAVFFEIEELVKTLLPVRS